MKYPFLRSAQLFISEQASLNTALPTTVGERRGKGTCLIQMNESNGHWGALMGEYGVHFDDIKFRVFEILSGRAALPVCKKRGFL